MKPPKWAKNWPKSRSHRVLKWIWALLTIPTLVWWSESILWVAFMSLYANFVGHWSSEEASRAKEEAERS